MNTSLREAVLKAAETENGKKRLSCGMAFQIARQLNVTPKEIGDLCEAEGIKIKNCQLGCF